MRNFAHTGKINSLKGITTKFCMSVDIHDVITNTTFCDDRLRGLGWQGVEVPISPLTGVVALYILALPCECVITDKKSQIPNPSVSLSVTLKVENLFFFRRIWVRIPFELFDRQRYQTQITCGTGASLAASHASHQQARRTLGLPQFLGPPIHTFAMTQNLLPAQEQHPHGV